MASRERALDPALLAHADRTRERIEEVTLPLLLERGYERTPLRLIAEAANVTAPAIYWHFSSKGELCCAAVAREFEKFAQAVSSIPAGPPDEQLRAWVATFMRWQVERRRGAMGLAFDDLVASLPREHRGRIRRIQRALNDQLRSILEEGRRRERFAVDDVTLAAFAITTMCTYVFTWYRDGGRLSIDEVADGYADIAIKLVGGVVRSPVRTR
jgi:AcrR family transcriptional regulator